LTWHFSVDQETRRTLQLTQVSGKGDGVVFTTVDPEDLNGLQPRLGGESVSRLVRALAQTVYLSAARQAETDVFPEPLDRSVRAGDVGLVGQYAAWWLYSEGDSPVEEARKNRKQAPEANTLRQQVNAWCGELFPGAAINAVPVPKTSLMQLLLRSGPSGDWSSPANIGYGVSYAFPILVAGLSATGSHPLVLDSPEAHLHPHGQSQMGGFLAQMAAAGSQILVETHSDHLLNGVRLAVRDGVIRPEDVAIYFFAPSAAAHVTRLSVDKHGTISDWPEGFFDQSEKDLASLAGWTA